MTSAPSSVQLFFLYDSHCPWSYAATPLINEINNAYPEITLHLWHNAFFSALNEADTHVTKQEITEVERIANINFSTEYMQTIEHSRNSTLAANIMTWAQLKNPSLALPLLNAIQEAHFNHGLPIESQADLAQVISELKLSPPAKVFKNEALTKDALELIQEVFALQDIIGTQAIPALLLAIDEELILLNHNFYLTEPKAIIDAVQLELDQYNN